MNRWIDSRPLASAWLVILLLGHFVSAASASGLNRANDSESGVRAWLELQASGRQAGSLPGQPGEATARAWQRYLESFEYPIPETFFEQKEGFVSE